MIKKRYHKSVTMKSSWLMVMLTACAQLFVNCDQVIVENDLYDISQEQGHVTMQVRYVTYSRDQADKLPDYYSVDMLCRTEYPTWFQLKDGQGTDVLDRLPRTFDTLRYEGYAQPGYYRLRTYAPAQGFQGDTTAVEVMADGQYYLRRPEPLFYGAWERQIAGGDVLNDTVVVRQRTRELVFRILMALGDSIRYVSSDVRLTNINYRLDLERDAIDPDYQTPMPLQMKMEMFRSEDGKVYPTLVDTINVLTPTADEYAEWMLSNTLSVRINFAYNLNGEQRRIQPVDCSFSNVLDPAYSADYVRTNNDPYCINRYVWQAADTVTFHTAVDTITSGDIIPWEIETEFGGL